MTMQTKTSVKEQGGKTLEALRAICEGRPEFEMLYMLGFCRGVGFKAEADAFTKKSGGSGASA